MAKILVIRFSSIGDIVLTSPVIRCLKRTFPHYSIHFLTKESFRSIHEANPHIAKIITFKSKPEEILSQLVEEDYDFVVDLQKNVKSMRLLMKLRTRFYSFPKLNLRKWLLVNFKIDTMPSNHIVDRYMEAVEGLGVENDHQGLEYFIPQDSEVDIRKIFGLEPNKYIVMVVGAAHATKQIPVNKAREIIAKLNNPVILLGGKEDQQKAQEISEGFQTEKTINAAGKFTLHQSASVIQQAHKVITGDTGLMHIAAAFKKDIISLWGNTVPEFGMIPYLAGENSKILQVENLKCRPCSKLGHKRCPQGHFACMNRISADLVKEAAESNG